MYKLISSGSKGNAVIYHGTILVDCGVPYSMLKSDVKNLKIILLTHEHRDHINPTTLSRLMSERPTLRIGCGRWMEPFVHQFKNVDYFDIGDMYDYGAFRLMAVKLYHDVPNCGYRIFKDDTSMFHATDTAHLEGIDAKGYDLYAIESNYNEETVNDVIMDLEARGMYAHQRGAINSHLSEQQANDFIYKNKADHSQVLKLHVSSSFV